MSGNTAYIRYRLGSRRKRCSNEPAPYLKAKRGPKAVNEYSEPERLYGEIGKLKMEPDWLKKSPGWIQCCSLKEIPFALNLSKGSG